MTGAVLREATHADVAAVLDLYAQPSLDDGDVLTREQALSVLAQFRRYPSYRLFVACEGDAVVGSYALLIMHNLAHRGMPSAIAEDVVVAPAAQRRGIGRQLMAHAMEQAAEAGCYKLALSSNARRTDAHAFYRALGFAPHGVSFVIETSA